MISIFKTEPQLCRPGEAAGPEMSAVGVTLSLPEVKNLEMRLGVENVNFLWAM